VKQISSFFDILEVDGLRESTTRKLIYSGFDSIKKILELKNSDIRGLEGFGDSKSESIVANIKSKLQEVELSKLQHATGIFLGLGSKKLKLLEGFKTKPTIAEVKLIEGFSDITASEYVEKYDEFVEWFKTVSNLITIKQEVVKNKEEMMNSKLEGKTFCITGTLSQPRKHFEALIEENGGVCKSMGKTLNYLIAGEDCGSKLSKAEAFGIPIITEEQFMEMIK
jgi:DNA ligase (NAD+)